MSAESAVEKRRKERRKAIRKRRIIKTLIALFIFCLILFVVLAFTVLFPVKTLIVSGSKFYTANQVASASKITQSTNLLTVSSTKLTEKIRAELPFVDSIKLERQLPDTLYIIVSDAKEFSCYSYRDKYYTVSKKGYVLKTYNELPEGMCEIKSGKIKCIEGQKIKVYDKNALQISSKIFKVLKTKTTVNMIDTTDNLNLKIRVDNRFDVILGGSSYIENKCKHLLAMIKNMEANTEGTVNLSMWTPEKKEGTFIRKNTK